MKKENWILALDASTKEVGICIWDRAEDKLIKLTHLTLPKEEKMLKKAIYFESYLLDLLKKYPLIAEVVIEEAFNRMDSGTTSAEIIAKLAQMNFAYQYICFKNNLSVSTISVAKSRSSAFSNLKLKQKKVSGGKGHKEQVFEHVLSFLGKNFFPTKIISKGKNKNQERFEDFCMDMSDAYTVCIGFLNLENEVIKFRNDEEGKEKNSPSIKNSTKSALSKSGRRFKRK